MSGRCNCKRWVVLFCFVAVLLVFAPLSYAAQPESSYWYPEDLLKWSPEKDPDATFNRGTIPLQGRVIGDKVNANATKEPKLVALSAMYPSTSGAPSQGGDSFDVYAFNYWQYVDTLVMWGGSAGEGIIVPPSADVIDAAHTNGVKVLGTVFFPPQVYGGKYEWVEQLLQQEADGSFPLADKLLEVATYYGFDGWFFNQETEGGNTEDAANMQRFLQYMQQHKPKDMHIMWYDSMVENGSIRWQNALTDQNMMFFHDDGAKVADSMFLNFWWRDMQSSHDKAKSVARSPYDLFAGIDVEANGYNTQVSWDGLFPAGKAAKTSLGIYRPDWSYKSSDSAEQFYAKEDRFWVGENGDPRHTDTKANWKGIAHYIVERSPIDKLPFTTHFNTGHGKFFAVDGKVLREKEWHNRSLQDVLPTWRWIADSEGKALKPSLDFDRAYYGGSSLKVTGDLSRENATHLKLYRTDLKVEKHTKLSVTYKTPFKRAEMKVGLEFADKPGEFVFLKTGPLKGNKWDTKKVSLNKYRGKTITAVSLKFDSKKPIDDFSLNVGQLSIKNKASLKKLPRVSNVTIDNAFKEGIYADARVAWQPVKNAARYEVYRIQSNGKKEFLGATPNDVYYVPQMKRQSSAEQKTTLEIVALDKYDRRGKRARATFEWPAYPRPAAAFTANQTVVAPGEEVQFFDQSSEVTQEVVWHFPGGEPTTSTEKKPVVRYKEEGVYPVTLTAKNAVGEDVITKEAFITVTKEAKGGVKNLALGKKATASSFVGSEKPDLAFDGKVTDNSKWCAVGDAPHWVAVDLGEMHKISEFVIKHAEEGGEPAAFNTSDYRIQLSSDGESWTDVACVNGNAQGVSKHAIPLTEARYARLYISKPTQGGDTAARIYEFEVHGLVK